MPCGAVGVTLLLPGQGSSPCCCSVLSPSPRDVPARLETPQARQERWGRAVESGSRTQTPSAWGPGSSSRNRTRREVAGRLALLSTDTRTSLGLLLRLAGKTELQEHWEAREALLAAWQRREQRLNGADLQQVTFGGT